MQSVKKATKKELEQFIGYQKPNLTWRRYLAFLIDFLVIYFVVITPFRPFLNSLPQAKDFSQFSNLFSSEKLTSLKPLFYIALTISFLTILYWAILEYKTGQTLGKKLLSIKVTSKENDLTFWQCFLRNISKINTLLLILDVFYMWYYQKNQRYLEVLSKTEVVSA